MQFTTHASEKESVDDEPSGDSYSVRTGYTLATLDEALVSKLLTMQRNCKAILTDGVFTDLVASVNPVQPVISEDVDLEQLVNDLKARIDTLEAG